MFADANATASADIDAKESTTSSVKVVPSVNVAGGLKESVNKYINMKQSSYKNTEHLAYEAAKSELIKEDREKAGKVKGYTSSTPPVPPSLHTWLVNQLQ